MKGTSAHSPTAQAALTAALPALTILGGCCGTDHRHVAALWGTAG